MHIKLTPPPISQKYISRFPLTFPPATLRTLILPRIHKTLQLINNYIKVSNTDYIGENKNCNPTYITSKDGSILVIYRHFWHDL